MASRLFPAVWNDWPSSASAYISIFANPDSDEDLSDPEGSAQYVKLLPLEEMEFIRLCIHEKKDIRQIFKETPTMLEKIVDLAISMSQISVDNEDDYKDDPNAFITEEMSLSTKYTCRTAASDLILEASDFWSDGVIMTLTNMLISFVDRHVGTRLVESCIFLLETVLVQDRSLGTHLFSTSMLDKITQIIHSGISSEDTFLRSRSFIFAGTFGRNLKSANTGSNIADELYDIALQSACDDSGYIVRASCLMSIQRFAAAITRFRHRPTQTAIVQSVNSLIADAADDTPSLLVDTLEIAIKINPDLAILPETQIIQLLFLSAAKDASNIQLTSDTFEAFETLAEFTDQVHYQKLCETAIPPLIQGLSATPTDDELANAVVSYCYFCGTSMTLTILILVVDCESSGDSGGPRTVSTSRWIGCLYLSQNSQYTDGIRRQPAFTSMIISSFSTASNFYLTS